MTDKLNKLMERVNMLQDVYETAVAEDDRWAANEALKELDQINKEIDQIEKEL